MTGRRRAKDEEAWVSAAPARPAKADDPDETDARNQEERAVAGSWYEILRRQRRRDDTSADRSGESAG